MTNDEYYFCRESCLKNLPAKRVNYASVALNKLCTTAEAKHYLSCYSINISLYLNKVIRFH